MRAKLDSPRMASGRQIAACLILVLIALSFAACGEDSPQGPKIPPDTAQTLADKLNVIQSRLTPEDECGSDDSAQTSLDSLQDYVDEVAKQDIDPQIISDLHELIDNVGQKVAAYCADPQSSTTDSTTTTTSTDITTTTDSTKETTDKSTTEPTEPTTSSTTTTTDPDLTTQPESPSPPSHSNAGGNGNGGATEGGFEAGGTSPGGRIPANGGGR
jgi:hypothetical protein